MFILYAALLKYSIKMCLLSIILGIYVIHDAQFSSLKMKLCIIEAYDSLNNAK
jgi:hypothetical protein